MSLIYCALDMFSWNQTIRIVSDDGENTAVYYTPIDNVADTIAAICKQENITDVRLYGSEGYLNSLAENIRAKYNLHYHCEKPLNIEVN